MANPGGWREELIHYWAMLSKYSLQQRMYDKALNLLCFSEPEEPLIWMRHNSGISQTGDEMQSYKITTSVRKMRHKANCPHMLLSISQKDFSWSFTVMIIKGVYMPWPGIYINLEGRKGGQTQTKRYPGNRDRWEITETKMYWQGREWTFSTEMHLGTEHGLLLINTRKTAWGPTTKRWSHGTQLSILLHCWLFATAF